MPNERVGDVGVPPSLPELPPKFAPALRIESDKVFGRKNQDGFSASVLETCRAGVAGRVGAVGPDKAARVSLQSDAGRARVEYDQVAPDQGRAGEPPAVGFEAILAQVTLPNDQNGVAAAIEQVLGSRAGRPS